MDHRCGVLDELLAQREFYVCSYCWLPSPRLVPCSITIRVEDAVTQNTASWIDRSLLNAVRKTLGTAPISLALPQVENRPCLVAPTIGTVRIANRSTLAALVMNPEVVFGEAYCDGRIEVEGDLDRKSAV